MEREELAALAEQAEAEVVRNALFALAPEENEMAKIGARRAASEWSIVATTLRRMAK
jgi:hypothetical protein